MAAEYVQRGAGEEVVLRVEVDFRGAFAGVGYCAVEGGWWCSRGGFVGY